MVTLANIPAQNNGSFNYRYNGIISYTIDLEEFPENNSPVEREVQGFSGVNNIQLDVSDQDGDALTYILVDPPSDGSVVFTERKRWCRILHFYPWIYRNYFCYC